MQDGEKMQSVKATFRNLIILVMMLRSMDKKNNSNVTPKLFFFFFFKTPSNFLPPPRQEPASTFPFWFDRGGTVPLPKARLRGRGCSPDRDPPLQPYTTPTALFWCPRPRPPPPAPPGGTRGPEGGPGPSPRRSGTPGSPSSARHPSPCLKCFAFAAVSCCKTPFTLVPVALNELI